MIGCFSLAIRGASTRATLGYRPANNKAAVTCGDCASCRVISSLAYCSTKPSPRKESKRSARRSRIVCMTCPLIQLFLQCWPSMRDFRASSQRPNAVLRAMWSEGGPSFGNNSAQWTALAAARFWSENGVASGDRCDSVAATVHAASLPPNSAPKSAIFPRRRSHGKRARQRPTGVGTYHASSSTPHRGAFAGRTPISTAPVARSVLTAWSMRAFGGGSSASEKHMGCKPELNTDNISSIREQRRISGVGISCRRRLKRAAVSKWKQKPSRTRPARPRRWSTSARDTNCSLSDDVLVGSWYLWLLTLPASTTKTTSGMVTPVSAMFVLSTTFRTPRRGRSKAFACSSPLSTLCNDNTSAFDGSPKMGCRPKRSDTFVISMRPGKNTRTAPSSRGTWLNFGESSISWRHSSTRSKLILVWSIVLNCRLVSSRYRVGSQRSASSSHAHSSSSSTYAETLSFLPLDPETWKDIFCVHPRPQPFLAKSLSSSHRYPDISTTSSSQKVSTGKVRPGIVRVGTVPPKYRESFSTSRVADISTTFKSVRCCRRICRSNRISRSQSALRSCTSSMKMCVTFDSAATPDCNCFNSTPTVQNSKRVESETRFSMRIW
mmetsp:Transcript_98088/g.299904  ORF Transcript_98088/g.299904 Transcript_98088/m.299904 type:complete len:607 (-) Transcript_98088:932-2752(-)